MYPRRYGRHTILESSKVNVLFIDSCTRHHLPFLDATVVASRKAFMPDVLDDDRFRLTDQLGILGEEGELLGVKSLRV